MYDKCHCQKAGTSGNGGKVGFHLAHPAVFRVVHLHVRHSGHRHVVAHGLVCQGVGFDKNQLVRSRRLGGDSDHDSRCRHGKHQGHFLVDIKMKVTRIFAGRGRRGRNPEPDGFSAHGRTGRSLHHMEAMFFSSPGSIGQEDRRKQKKAHRKKREKDPSRKTGLSGESWLCRTSHAHVFLLPVPPDPYFRTGSDFRSGLFRCGCGEQGFSR